MTVTSWDTLYALPEDDFVVIISKQVLRQLMYFGQRDGCVWYFFQKKIKFLSFGYDSVFGVDFLDIFDVKLPTLPAIHSQALAVMLWDLYIHSISRFIGTFDSIPLTEYTIKIHTRSYFKFNTAN